MIWERFPEYDRRLLELDAQGLTQLEIAESMSQEFGITLTRNQIKNRLARVSRTTDYVITGVTAEDRPDFETAFQRAREEYQKKHLLNMRKTSQRIAFSHSPICIVFVGDHHMGNAGTDVERVFDEARIIAETPGMYLATLGDFFDGFILQKLRFIRDNSRQGIEDEWALLEGYLDLVKEKLLLCVSGNHEGWSQDLTGRDWLRRTVAEYSPKALYDADDCRVVIEASGVEFPTRVRHLWRGNSIYNATHGIERAQKFDQDFVLGVGGHIHTAGVSRQFPAAGRNGLAVLVGSYKRHDTFGAELGLPKPNQSTAIAVLFDAETKSMVGMDNLAMASKVMRSII